MSPRRQRRRMATGRETRPGRPRTLGTATWCSRRHATRPNPGSPRASSGTARRSRSGCGTSERKKKKRGLRLASSLGHLSLLSQKQKKVLLRLRDAMKFFTVFYFFFFFADRLLNKLPVPF